MKKICVVFCFLCWIAKDIHAQNNTVATGGVASGSGGSATYSVGQIDYTTQSGAGGNGIEGLQQPFELFVTGIEEVKADNLTATVFPNPATNYIELHVADTPDGGVVNYALFDLTGKCIVRNSVQGGQAIINVASLASGLYLLSVSNSTQILKTFKINITK